MNPDSQQFRGISRLDQPAAGTHGWQVRIQRKGVRYGRFFSDEAWGGPERALRVALRFRDRIIAHNERVMRNRGHRSIRSHDTPGARNQSGVIGVTRISQISAKGVEYHFWQASWTSPGGERRMKRFSVLKLGEEEAFALACRARKEAVKKRRPS